MRHTSELFIFLETCSGTLCLYLIVVILGPGSSPQTDSSVQSIGKSFAPGINRFSPTPSYSGYPVLNNMPTANYNSNLNDGYGFNNQINSEQNNQGTPSKYGGTGYVTSSGGVYQVEMII